MLELIWCILDGAACALKQQPVTPERFWVAKHYLVAREIEEYSAIQPRWSMTPDARRARRRAGVVS